MNVLAFRQPIRGSVEVEPRNQPEVAMSDESIDEIAFAELEELGGGDDEFLLDVLTTYLEQGGMLLEEARAAHSPAELIRAIHALGGSSRSVAALGLARLCTAIETDAGKRPERAAMEKAVEAVAEAFGQVTHSLQRRITQIEQRGRVQD